MMIELEFPGADVLRETNDYTLEELPRFATVERQWDLAQIDDVEAASKAAVNDIDAIKSLPAGAEIMVTAGSRGVHDMPATLSAAIEELQHAGTNRSSFRRWEVTMGRALKDNPTSSHGLVFK